jgi:hypothetical protein
LVPGVIVQHPSRGCELVCGAAPAMQDSLAFAVGRLGRPNFFPRTPLEVLTSSGKLYIFRELSRQVVGHSPTLWTASPIA